MMHKLTPFHCTLTTVVVYFVTGICGGVQETSKSYICSGHGEEIRIHHEQHISSCEQSWYQRDLVIAGNGNWSLCVPPCAQLFPDGIGLSDCANVSVNIFCEDNEVLEEMVIHYTGVNGEKFKASPVPGDVNDSGHSWTIGLTIGLTAFVVVAVVVGVIWSRHRTQPFPPDDGPL